ncbi:hypothetical protein AYL99_01134 [Fonsecaea erecta]|uniref:Heterokaryon incompatibility domain-containing protein n=1 Tax=Fonsecaea erecta TaxID=1367422 RepID=A0A178ZZK4_9EURO|nr:hypothetical protein AYL99_01134 [Fonsecaea erecta]OAP65162.1 hypothetical protein AYL99_01134 [Fonsecaea erecta]
MEFHNMRQLVDSADEGCHLCSLILLEIPPSQREKYLEDLERDGDGEPQIVAVVWYYRFPDERRPPVPYLRIEEAKLRPPVVNRVIICEFQCHLPEDERQMRRLLKHVQPFTGSWETFNDIHYWLRECENVHTRCAQRRQERRCQLPTRLLQVGAFDPGPRVYLRQSSQILPDSRYATLSHCWGQNMPVKLEQSTLQAFSEGLDIASLPRTFQEAIGLTKALGIDYLWIDSLCIIQDSPDDWAYECTRMSSVYMGSFVNIGANVSADSSGGLFCQRSWKSVNALAVRLTYPPIGWHRKPVILYPKGEGNILDHAPLGSRAWVAQERLLAPRTIHFLQHKVVWECDECMASESDVTGRLEGKYFVKRTYLARPTATNDNHDQARTRFLHTWADIVSFYSAGRLSVATDKLIAISGVAKYVQSTLSSDRSLQYYAGHWGHNFEMQLTWSASCFSVGNRLPTYIAPSWSWASYNGAVLFPRPYRRTLWATLVDIDVHPVSDPFGAIRSGSIRMRGPLCRAVLPDTRVLVDEERPKTLRLLGSDAEIECVDLSFDDEVSEPEMAEDGAEQQTHLVMFGIMQGEDTDDRPFEGIILRLTGLQPGQYKRIGAFRVDDLVPRSLEEQQTQERIYAIFGGDPQEFERDNFGALRDEFDAMDMPEQYFEEKGDDWYEFTII